MLRRLILFTCASLIIGTLGTIVLADEGMWLFNHPPIENIKAQYNFTVTPAWLEHLQKSSVRFNSCGAGSLCADDGLTFTNHHIAQTCLHGLSTAARDLFKTGFYARTPGDEA